MNNIYMRGFILFLIAICVIELLSFVILRLRAPERARIRKRLRNFTYAEDLQSGGDILRKRQYSEISFINRMISGIRPIQRLDRLLIQANSPYSLWFYAMLTLLIAAVGFLVGAVMLKNVMMGGVIALAVGSLPFLQLIGKKHGRVEKFRRQMPEGLDLIARALKAGHALPGGMKLAADQFEDPLGPEFSEALDEISFGVGVANALKNMASRIDCPEVRFFCAAIIIQRETGGNLAELMENLAHLIRENYKFQGRLRTLTAEGKISAIVLIALPFLLATWIKTTTPAFFNPLMADHIGHLLLLSAAGMMTIGIFVIMKMVKFDV